MPVLRTQPLKPSEQFTTTLDDKLRMTLIGMADKYSQDVRELIYKCYNDPHLASIYRGMRNAGMYQKGGKVHRKLLEFPNPWVYDFVDTVLTQLYDENWFKNTKALHHELVRPWWVVEKI